MKVARRQHACTLPEEVDIDSNSNGKDAILNRGAVQAQHIRTSTAAGAVRVVECVSELLLCFEIPPPP